MARSQGCFRGAVGLGVVDSSCGIAQSVYLTTIKDMHVLFHIVMTHGSSFKNILEISPIFLARIDHLL
jgi:hypothetical protein